MARARVIFKGRVQGVFFRNNVQEKAARAGICGWVKNLPNGTVDGLFEGDEDKVRQILTEIKNGEHMGDCRVDDMDVRWVLFTPEYHDFCVLR
jgi:acylphosphatase